jgi:hypothetical protein
MSMDTSTSVLRKFADTVCAVLLLGAPLQSALCEDCLCSSINAIDRPNEYQGCLTSCEIAKQYKKTTEALRARMPDDLKTIVPAYIKAREVLRDTAPSDPSFAKVFDEYQEARMRRDSALLAQYQAEFNLLSTLFLRIRAPYDVLDEKYEMPEFARQYFHDYAIQIGKAAVTMLDSNPHRVDSRYPHILDQAEVQAWARKHGGPIPKLVFGRVYIPKPGDFKDELTATQRTAVSACNKEAHGIYPGEWVNYANKTIAAEANAYFDACVDKSCRDCKY